MESSVKLYALSYRSITTYAAAALFAAGNLVLPQLCHLLPQGGMTWLPIYFFTLISAYKYGWRVGLLTAVCSPLLNSLLFGMPAPSAMPAILLKSVLLALCAAWAAYRFKRVTWLLLLGVVATYQLVGSLGEWAFTGSAQAALQDLRIGYPGMITQVVGGYLFIKYLLHK